MTRWILGCLLAFTCSAPTWAEPVEGLLHHGSITLEHPDDVPGWYLLHPDRTPQTVSVALLDDPERFVGRYVRITGDSDEGVVSAETIALFPQGPRRTFEGVLIAPEQPHAEIYLGWRVETADGRTHEVAVDDVDLDGLGGAQVIVHVTARLGTETVSGIGRCVHAENVLRSLQALENHQLVAAFGAFEGQLRLDPEPELWGSATKFPTLGLDAVDVDGLVGEQVRVHGRTRAGVFEVSAIEPTPTNLRWLLEEAGDLEGIPLEWVGTLGRAVPEAGYTGPDWYVVVNGRGYGLDRFSEWSEEIDDLLNRTVLVRGHLERSEHGLLYVVDALRPLP